MCKQQFTAKWNLSRHFKLTHSALKSKYLKHIKKGERYTCKVCGMDYSHSFNLKQHILKHHKEQELIIH